ncbi:MAG: TlpA family protein disulfide reductase [Caldilinea sp. CFX5]|nr:TlpA family protein disulfide reductase [Caldilinea sp. CFX5]
MMNSTAHTDAVFTPVANKPSMLKRSAKITAVLIAIGLLLFAGSVFLATYVWNGLEAGQPAPTFSAHDLTGKPIRLADYSGKPVMLTFWSPDCGACREELPALQTIAADPNAEVTLVTVVSKMPAAEVQPFVAEAGLTFPVIVDEAGKIAEAYEIVGVPVSYFINSDGTIDHSIIGAGREGDLQNNLFAWLSTCRVDEVCK